MIIYAAGRQSTYDPERDPRVRDLMVLASYSTVRDYPDYRKRVKRMAKRSRDDEISVGSLFLDSGSFSMRQQAAKFAKETGRDWKEFYDTTEFWSYCDDYVAFVTKHQKGIDVYANIDVLPDLSDRDVSNKTAEDAAVLSWRNQQYLESKGIKPIPVVHLGTHLRWLKKYIDAGYDYIGLGGMVAAGGFGNHSGVSRWLDRVFGEVVCDTKDRLPIVKTHGFGLMGPIVFRYPFYSVDSTSWVMKGSFGQLIMPQKRRGVYRYDLSPILIAIHHIDLMRQRMEKSESEDRKRLDVIPWEDAGIAPGIRRYELLTRMEQQAVKDWLKYIDIPLGRVEKGEIVEEGINNSRSLRILAGVRYFQKFMEMAPPYPQPFHGNKRRNNLNLV